mmetsp:Transcript_36981/g.78424  ORF Transcript_36981/g.78424 Transcript_36981/m.78424 type:complete len:249 (-) Transcript_36981:2388-3134(-)
MMFLLLPLLVVLLAITILLAIVFVAANAAPAHIAGGPAFVSLPRNHCLLSHHHQQQQQQHHYRHSHHRRHRLRRHNVVALAPCSLAALRIEDVCCCQMGQTKMMKMRKKMKKMRASLSSVSAACLFYHHLLASLFGVGVAAAVGAHAAADIQQQQQLLQVSTQTFPSPAPNLGLSDRWGAFWMMGPQAMVAAIHPATVAVLCGGPPPAFGSEPATSLPAAWAAWGGATPEPVTPSGPSLASAGIAPSA